MELWVFECATKLRTFYDDRQVAFYNWLGCSTVRQNRSLLEFLCEQWIWLERNGTCFVIDVSQWDEIANAYIVPFNCSVRSFAVHIFITLMSYFFLHSFTHWTFIYVLKYFLQSLFSSRHFFYWVVILCLESYFPSSMGVAIKSGCIPYRDCEHDQGQI